MITLRLMKPQIPKLKALLKAAAEKDTDMRILHDDLVYFIAKEKQKEDRRHLQRKKTFPQMIRRAVTNGSTTTIYDSSGRQTGSIKR